MNGMLTQSQLRALITGRSASFAVGVRGVIAEFHWAIDYWYRLMKRIGG